MNDQQVKIVINGEDKSGPAFSSASKSVSGLSSQFSGLAKVVGGGLLAGGAAFTAFLYSSGKAAADAEVQMARVNATLKAMGDSALKNKDAILQAADAAVQLGFDDEDSAESITKLYQRTNDLSKALELNQLAMDISAGKNISLADATDLVAKANSGNARELKAMGIAIDENATSTQILMTLQETYAGQAKESSQTFAGQMKVLSTEFDNFKETVGTALLEAIMPFVKQLSEWAAKKETQEKIKAISDAIGYWASVVLPVAIDVIKLWWGWLRSAYDALVDIEVKIISLIDKIATFTSKLSGAVKSGASTLGSAWANAGSNLKWAVGLEGRASGGPVIGGTSYVVGENGPEIFTPGQSGMITPNGGGGVSIVISGNTLLDSSAAEKMADMLVRTLKQNLRI